MGDKKICIVVGHNYLSPGAKTLWGESEYQYNSNIANLQKGVDIHFHTPTTSYTSQCKNFIEDIKGKEYDLIIELHLNSFNGNVQRCEGVYYKGNDVGKRICDEFTKRFSKAFGIDEGISIARTKDDRGGGMLSACKATTVILEPFFCDHEYAYMLKEPYKYAKFLNEFTKLCKESLLP